jgi:hypothetical protein
MMNFEPLGGADEQNVAAFEQQIGFTLPKDYRRFLVENNGAEILDQTFFVKDLDKEVMLDVLFGVVIGHDPGGHQLLLITDGEDKGICY